MPVARALRAEGFDASEDGTGRGTPIVPCAIRTSQTGANGHGFADDVAHALDQSISQAVAYRTSGNCGAWSIGDHVDTLSTGTDPSSHLVAFDTTQITSKANRSNPKSGAPCHPLAAGAHAPAVAFDWQAAGGGNDTSWRGKSRKHIVRANGLAGACNTSRVDAVSVAMSVRRLLPEECEILQGFPPGFTDVPFKGKPASDGPRYRALGNSMAVPCVRWILSRIEVQSQAHGPPDYLRATRQ